MGSKPPFRLLIVSQPMGEGVPQHVLDLIPGIDPDQYEIDVACPFGSTLWAGLAGRNGVRLHEIREDRMPSPADLVTLWKLLPLVRRADVVHAHSAKAGFLTRLAALLQGARARCIFTPHAWSFWATSGLRSSAYTQVERVAARWCRTIIAVSEHERDAGLAVRVGRPSQYRVVVNGIDLDRFSRAPQPQAGNILMVGRLSEQKRPDLAIEALHAVRERRPDAKLQLAGRGPWSSWLEQRVAELGLDSAVSFLGAREDVPRLLSQAACLVLPSDYEGCPLSVIEAMAAGVPVVATRVGGVPELVEHERTGLLVGPGDPQGLASALCAVLEDPDRARRMGAAGRDTARRNLSRERMAAATVAIYDAVAIRASAGDHNA